MAAPTKRFDSRQLSLFFAERRREMGDLSPRQMAEMLYCSLTSLRDWDRGYVIPGDDSCRKIAYTLGGTENEIREMVGRPQRDNGADEMYVGVTPPPDMATLPYPRSAPVEKIKLCECGTRIMTGRKQCEWCRQDWGYREYLRWCVNEGRVIESHLQYKQKAKTYFRLNGWRDA